MARIFAYAAYVHVWLGEEEDESSQVMWLIQYVVEADSHSADPWEPLVAEQGQTWRNRILNLLNRAWFERVWVGSTRRLQSNHPFDRFA